MASTRSCANRHANASIAHDRGNDLASGALIRPLGLSAYFALVSQSMGIETMQTSDATGAAMYGFLACTVSQFMTRAVKTVRRQTTMRELGDLFEKHDFNAFPVLENGKMMGIVSKFDFLRAFAFTSSQIVPRYDELMNRVVADVMTEAVVHVDPTSPLTRVLELMVSLKTRSFPVLNTDRQLQGIISREDIMRALKETTRQGASK